MHFMATEKSRKLGDLVIFFIFLMDSAFTVAKGK